MPRNGSGTYSLPAGNPVVTNTTISSTWANTTLSDMATGLTNSIAKDGQTTPTANLPMGGFKLTGMGVGNSNTDSVTLGQVQNQAFVYLGGVAGTDTITATTSPVTTSYVAGQVYRFAAAATNTGAVTININSLGAKSITKDGTTELVAGDIVSGAVVTVIYDGTRFQLQNAATVGTANYQNASITQAKLGTNVAGTGPAFSAYANISQSIASGTPTIVVLGTESYDTNSNFASNRFTATVAGYYLFTGIIRANATNLTAANAVLYVNGASYRQGSSINTAAITGVQTVVVTELIHLNATDYVELYGTIVGSSPQFNTVSSTQTSSLSGVLVRAE